MQNIGVCEVVSLKDFYSHSNVQCKYSLSNKKGLFYVILILKKERKHL